MNQDNSTINGISTEFLYFNVRIMRNFQKYNFYIQKSTHPKILTRRILGNLLALVKGVNRIFILRMTIQGQCMLAPKQEIEGGSEWNYRYQKIFKGFKIVIGYCFIEKLALSSSQNFDQSPRGNSSFAYTVKSSSKCVRRKSEISAFNLQNIRKQRDEEHAFQIGELRSLTYAASLGGGQPPPP